MTINLLCASHSSKRISPFFSTLMGISTVVGEICLIRAATGMTSAGQNIVNFSTGVMKQIMETPLSFQSQINSSFENLLKQESLRCSNFRLCIFWSFPKRTAALLSIKLNKCNSIFNILRTDNFRTRSNRFQSLRSLSGHGIRDFCSYLIDDLIVLYLRTCQCPAPS